MDLYTSTLMGLAALALPVLLSAHFYLRQKLRHRHDDGLLYIGACFFVWFFTSFLSSEKGGNSESTLFIYLLSGGVNALFLWSMSFFQPGDDSPVGRWYERINWRNVVLVLALSYVALFTVFRKPSVRDWLDVLISSAVILLFTLGMALVFWHRKPRPMSVVSALNGIALVLVQGYHYQFNHPAGDILWAPGVGLSDEIGQPLHLVARAGLVFCVLLLSLTWSVEQSAVIDKAEENLPHSPEASNGNRLSFGLEGNKDVSVKFWLGARADLHDWTKLPAREKEKLVNFAWLTLRGEDLVHKKFSNFSRDKSVLLQQINSLQAGKIQLKEADLFARNVKGTTTLRVDAENIQLPDNVLKIYGLQ